MPDFDSVFPQVLLSTHKGVTSLVVRSISPEAGKKLVIRVSSFRVAGFLQDASSEALNVLTSVVSQHVARQDRFILDVKLGIPSYQYHGSGLQDLHATLADLEAASSPDERLLVLEFFSRFLIDSLFESGLVAPLARIQFMSAMDFMSRHGYSVVVERDLRRVLR